MPTGIASAEGTVRGYRPVQKVVHWLTVTAMAAQLAVGYNLDLDGREDCDPPGEGAQRRRHHRRFEDRLDRLEDACEARAGDFDMVGGGFDLAELHLALGLTVLALGLLRPLVRRRAGLPPWSEHLSAGQRRLAGITEKSLMLLLVVVPLSGCCCSARVTTDGCRSTSRPTSPSSWRWPRTCRRTSGRRCCAGCS